MRRFICIPILLALWIPTLVSADSINLRGEWRNKKFRSLELIPPPSASIEGNMMFIYIENPLSNLLVTIKDSDNNIVYLDCITTYQSNKEILVDLRDLPEGDYTLSFTHEYGYLYGKFIL